jgi:hypothetical protein
MRSAKLQGQCIVQREEGVCITLHDSKIYKSVGMSFYR